MPAICQATSHGNGVNRPTWSREGRELFRYASAKKCPVILLEQDRPLLLVDGQAQPFNAAAFGACTREALGYSMLYDADARTRSTADAILFLKRTLQP